MAYKRSDSVGYDDCPLATAKILIAGGFGAGTTTLAVDFGRITVESDLVLYLFGTPGQDRFWFMWDELASGALGAAVLADTRRLGDCFASVDFFERRATPFIVAVNCFEGAPEYDAADIRIALDLDPRVPVIACDARQRESARQVLIRVVEHALTASQARRNDPRGGPGGSG